MKTKDILIAARELIADPARWTQRALARTANGMGSHATHPAATCFCAAGAAVRCTPEGQSWERTWATLDWAAMKMHDEPAAWVNDNLGHEAVLKVYDRAILDCED